LIIRKYKDATTISLILFPDGSGSLFYPSGRIAVKLVKHKIIKKNIGFDFFYGFFYKVSISLVNEGMHIVSIFNDDDIFPIQLASFDPYGNAMANYPNGSIKYII
jgi:hypothetical protein